MTTIHSFLQRRRLREFSHGIYMVFAAYALSFLLLIVGSDALYNIKSKANGFEKQPNGVNKILVTKNEEEIIDSYDTADIEQSDYGTEYRYDYLQKHVQKYYQSPTTEGDANQLMGFAMSSEEYSNMLSYMNSNSLSENEVSIQNFSQNAIDSSANTITSFSMESLAMDRDSLSADGTNMEAIAKTSLVGDDLVVEALANEELVTEDLSADEAKSSVRIVASKEEVKMLERIVEAEATGEGMKGKILVANVILNRIEDDEFPDTIEGVIFHKVGGEYQFSPISDKRFWKVKVTDETKEAVQRAIDGEDQSEGALFFMARKRARKSSARWFDNNLKWLFKHGGHEFYR